MADENKPFLAVKTEINPSDGIYTMYLKGKLPIPQKGVTYYPYRLMNGNKSLHDLYIGEKSDTLYVLVGKYLTKGCIVGVPFAYLPGVGRVVSSKVRDLGCEEIPPLFFEWPFVLKSKVLGGDSFFVTHEFSYEGINLTSSGSIQSGIKVEYIISREEGIVSFKEFPSYGIMPAEVWYWE